MMSMNKLLLCLVLMTAVGCTVNNVDIDDSLQKHFEAQGAKGTFGMFDNSRGTFTIYDLEAFRNRYSPASTFKSTVIPWDGVMRDRPEWNRDLSLYQAFRVSAVPHFQALARMIGKDTMQYWLDTLAYGNKRIGSVVDGFWLDTTLLISPDEQLGLVKRLYFRQLPFRSSVQESVTKMMIQENNAKWQLAWKTGMTVTSEGIPQGWMVGWIEENRHVYPFALHIELAKGREADMMVVRERILRDILASLGFFKGIM
jgi:beta-lactamase class D